MENVKVERKHGAVFVNYHGEITLEVTGSLKKRLEEVLESGGFDHIVMELSDVSFIDSSGIGFLVSLNTKIRGLGKKMYLYRPSSQIKKTLDLVQLTNFFHILEDEDELLGILPD